MVMILQMRKLRPREEKQRLLTVPTPGPAEQDQIQAHLIPRAPLTPPGSPSDFKLSFSPQNSPAQQSGRSLQGPASLAVNPGARWAGSLVASLGQPPAITSRCRTSKLPPAGACSAQGPTQPRGNPLQHTHPLGPGDPSGDVRTAPRTSL